MNPWQTRSCRWTLSAWDTLHHVAAGRGGDAFLETLLARLAELEKNA